MGELPPPLVSAAAGPDFMIALTHGLKWHIAAEIAANLAKCLDNKFNLMLLVPL